MRVVTTCHKAGWEQYGLKCFDGMRYWPTIDLRWYTEGFDLPRDRGTGIRNETLPKLTAFKARHADYLAPDWRYDVVRFANKIYAVHDALYDHRGLGVWMDADIIASKSLPKGYIESLLPTGCYLALFQRDGSHSECGLWVVDCDHPQHKAFLDHLLHWYEKDAYKEAHEWHDSALMDLTVRAFVREGLIDVHNLSGVNSKEPHPMAKHPCARYFDHLKGPDRKRLGYSPERSWVNP